MSTSLIPGPTTAARLQSQLRFKAYIPPTEPTEAEIDKCEAQLEQAWQELHAAQLALAALEAAQAEAKAVANTNTVLPPRRRRA